MTDPDKLSLRTLATAATPGPWETLDGAACCVYGGRKSEAGEHAEICDTRSNEDRSLDQNIANSAYIAAAHPQAVLGLLDEIEGLATRLRESEDACAVMVDALEPFSEAAGRYFADNWNAGASIDEIELLTAGQLFKARQALANLPASATALLKRLSDAMEDRDQWRATSTLASDTVTMLSARVDKQVAEAVTAEARVRVLEGQLSAWGSHRDRYIQELHDAQKQIEELKANLDLAAAEILRRLADADEKWQSWRDGYNTLELEIIGLREQVTSLETSLAEATKSARTPGTVEVCAGKQCNRLIYSPADACRKRECPIKPRIASSEAPGDTP